VCGAVAVSGFGDAAAVVEASRVADGLSGVKLRLIWQLFLKCKICDERM